MATKKTAQQPSSTTAVPQKVRDIAEKDGNAFHARVARYFRQKGWSVVISPYYIDNATGQKAEIPEEMRRLMSERDGAVAEV